jgi:hypothetical protein
LFIIGLVTQESREKRERESDRGGGGEIQRNQKILQETRVLRENAEVMS